MDAKDRAPKEAGEKEAPTRVDLKTFMSTMRDIVFKKVFVERPHLLVHLLKSVLDLPDSEYDGLCVECSEILPEHVKGKLGILDIKLRTTSGMTIDIEVERGNSTHMPGRILFYVSGLIRRQLDAGGEYDEMRRVIGLVITERALVPGDAVFHHKFTLYDVKAQTMLTDLLEVNTIELSKMPEADDGSDLWGWLNFLTLTTWEELDMLAERGPAFMEAARTLSEFSMNRRELELLDKRIGLEWEAAMERKDAIREGWEKGTEEGMRKKALQTAKILKAKNIAVQDIADATGLTIDDILRL